MAQARFCQIGQDFAPDRPGIGKTTLVQTVQADAQAEGITSLLLRRQPRNRRQHVLQLEVVHLHAIIEIELDALLGQGQQRILFPGLAVLEDFGDFFGLLAGGGAIAGGEGIVELIEAELGLAGFQFLQVGAEVVVENEVEGVSGFPMNGFY